MKPRSMPLTIFALAASCGYTFAQSAASVTASSTRASTSSPSSDYPTRTIFLPLSNLGNIAASIVTAAPDSTVYGLACLHATPSNCPYNASVTITEGPGTLIYTMSYEASDSLSTTKGPATVNCTYTGGMSASEALCQGATSISGLGAVSSTTTFAGPQLSFVPVSITAGAEKLSHVSTQTAAPSGTASSTSSGLGSAFTAVGWLAGGAAGMVALGVL